MKANVNYSAEMLTHLNIRLVNASLMICTGETDEISVQVFGRDGAIHAQHEWIKGGCFYLHTQAAEICRWMHVDVEIVLPATWKGDMDIRIGRGSLHLQKLSGTDIKCRINKGYLTMIDLQAITIISRVRMGEMRLQNCQTDQLRLSGCNVKAEGDLISADRVHIRTLSGNVALSMSEAFHMLKAATLTSSVQLWAPMECCNVYNRSVRGRLWTGGVSIVDKAPTARMNSFSGNFEINNNIVY